MLVRLTALTLPLLATAQYTATYYPTNTPDKSEEGQTGTNRCGTTASQSSMCQNAFVNSVDDFCLWSSPHGGKDSDIAHTEQIEVAWCTKDGYGTRLIPDGTLKGVHFVQTPDYIQITGQGDFTKMNIPAGDDGGELDPHSYDGRGNPVGGLVFSSAFGQMMQIHEWTNFMSSGSFCIRACKPGRMAKSLCQHIYDVMGCGWNMPGNYAAGVFEECQGDSAEPMGVYGTSTFHQGDPLTPSAHPIPSSSKCSVVPSISNGGAPATIPPSPTAVPTTITSVSRNATSSASSSSSGTVPLASVTSTLASSSSSTSGRSSTATASLVSSSSSSSSSSTSSAPSLSASNGATLDANAKMGWVVGFAAMGFML